ncbi:MAG: hypothetical protein U0163_09600 [Gemmatimonadaceae bacterium]
MRAARVGAALVLSVTLACNADPATSPADGGISPPTSGTAVMQVVGHGVLTDRFTAEVWARPPFAYTTTWGRRGQAQTAGNAINIWNVSSNTPVLVDSVIVGPGVTTIGDVEVSDDGSLLVVPTEFAPGSIRVFDLSNPRKPVLRSTYTSAAITQGVHTCEIERVNGRLYAFLAINRGPALPSSLEIVDLTDPTNPTRVFGRAMGIPFIHDVFVRDGILFTALWNDGLVLWDIGGGGKGGSVSSPVEMGRIVTQNGEVHNVWWYHDGLSGDKRFVFVGEEGPGAIGASSIGDIHVVDISNPAAPVEVAFFNVPEAGTHNFSVDEAHGFLYAAYYNAGVQVLDVRGDLSACASDAKVDGRCDLRKSGHFIAEGLRDQGTPVYVWGVHAVNGFVYASDMLNGLWKLRGYTR